jgi:hypothetical protein
VFNAIKTIATYLEGNINIDEQFADSQ